MPVSAQEAAELREYVMRLNDAGGGDASSVAVAVEGRRDTAALRMIGYAGRIIEFHRFGGIGNFVDHAAGYDTVIVLFDGDRKGRYMTGRVTRMLQRRTNVDLSFRRRLRKVTRGRITFIEQLACYEPVAAPAITCQ